MAEGKQQKKEEKGPQSIIRIAGRDINGALSIERALSHVKGIGMNMSHSMSYVIEQKFKISKETPIGSLDDKQIADIESVIKKPDAFGIPVYLLNKRKESETGQNLHYVGNDLTFSVRQDINREVNLRTWRGFRHKYGQRVRGQRTRSTGRTGTTIGVMKKSAMRPGSAPAAAAAADKGKNPTK